MNNKNGRLQWNVLVLESEKKNLLTETDKREKKFPGDKCELNCIRTYNAVLHKGNKNRNHEVISVLKA